MSLSTSPYDVFGRFRDRVLSGEWAASDALHGEDMIVEAPFAPPGRPRRFRGRAEFEAHHANRAALPVRFEEFRNVTVHETTDPEVIVVEYEMAGTVTTTGRSASAPFVLVLRVRDGRVLLWREYQNVLTIAEALGTQDALFTGVGAPESARAALSGTEPVASGGANAAAPLVTAASLPLVPDPATPSGPRAVYERILRAALDGSPDDYADLYVADAILEFPFTTPGFPRSLRGREAIRGHLRATFGTAIRLEGFRDVTVHETTDPDLIIAEHTMVGTATANGLPCAIGDLLVLTVRDGRIVHQRDYLDVIAAAGAAGRLPG